MMRIPGVISVVDVGLEESYEFFSLGTDAIVLNHMERFRRVLDGHYIRRHRNPAGLVRNLTDHSHAYALRKVCICAAGGSVLF